MNPLYLKYMMHTYVGTGTNPQTHYICPLAGLVSILPPTQLTVVFLNNGTAISL